MESYSNYVTAISAVFILTVLFTIVYFILTIVAYLKTKKKLYIYSNIVTAIACIILFYVNLPLIFYCIAMDKFIETNVYNQSAVDLQLTAAKISLCPIEKANIYIDLSSYYSRYNKGQKAIESFEKATEYVNSKELLSFSPTLYIAKGDYDKAIEYFKIKNYPQILAEIYLLKNDYKSALDYANIAISKKPENANAYPTRAIIYSNMGKEKTAQRDFDKAKALVQDSHYKPEVKAKKIMMIEKMEKNSKSYYQDYYREMKIKNNL